MDLLALPTLTVIGDTLRSVKQNRDVHTDLSKIDGNDPAPFAMLRNSGTIRTFQLESPTQGAIHRRLALNHFEDFIVSICLVRPGPLKFNMTRHGRKSVTYLHHQLLGLLYLLNQTNRPYYISWLKRNR